MIVKLRRQGGDRYDIKTRSNSGLSVCGAVGDALGYPVEFMREKKIFRTYGSKGICAYDPDPYSDGQALISDDTQMVLFTANGLLNAQTQNSLDGTQTPARVYIQKAYQDWLITQETIFERRSKMADTWKKCTGWQTSRNCMNAGRRELHA